MANTYNGYTRRKRITVSKLDALGQNLEGYPKTYLITDAFGSYSQITDFTFSTMSESSYQQRLAAFKTYVEGLNTDLDFDAAQQNDPTGYDADNCPIGQEVEY